MEGNSLLASCLMTFMDTPSGRFLCVYSRYVSAVLPVKCFNVRKWKYVL